jgi:hypothetical protein
VGLEGWYLLSDREVEEILIAVKSGEAGEPPTPRLSRDDALAKRNEGNLPDDEGRVLRLFLSFDDEGAGSVEQRRLLYEPDFHAAPNWRRPGSRPINVIPLGLRHAPSDRPWWEDPDVAELEREWSSSGRVAGVVVPAEYRSFVYKTVIALRAADKEVSVGSISDSAARWLPERQAAELRSALDAANERT